ncbi:hypothetical protein EYF80_044948 [Liparis tanakae]|uniref:Uncharacterized protein n=1 Tax=Liparis tanakae TaxID=230148 RepID=A0A4Z2FUL9_9TELE|nr:hypothetical protein EYF80_044948 [Liparis tanakae]
MVYFTHVACCSVSSSSSFFSRFFPFSLSSRSMEVIRWSLKREVGVHKGPRDVGLQLDDGETQGGDGQAARPVDGAVPLELRRGGQAELVGEVAPLVVVLAVLVLVQGQDVGAVLVVVDPVFTLLAQFEQVVQIHRQVPFQEAEARRAAFVGQRRGLKREEALNSTEL